MCVLVTSSYPVYAEENTFPDGSSSAHNESTFTEDSSNISKEILALLPLKDGDQVIRVYETDIEHAFHLCSNIDELLYTDVNTFMLIVYVIRSADGTYANYRIENGECIPFGNNAHYHRIMDAYLDGTMIYAVDPEIIVENMYYIAERGYIVDNAIYYKTNLGDYVYMKSTLDETFLFSLEAFLEYQAGVYASILERPNDNYLMGGKPYDPGLDLSAYQIGSPNFNPNAKFPTPKPDNSGTLWLIGGISSGIILGVAAAWVFLHRRKNTNVPTDPV